jgi:hypothetical protein
MRFVLSWPDAPRDLDFHILFKTGKFSKCEVFFGKTECSGANLDVNNYLGGGRGVETVTLNTIGNFNYTIVVHKYNGKAAENADSNRVKDAPVLLPAEEQYRNIPDINLYESQAKVSVYAPGFKRAIKELEIPYNRNNNYLDQSKDKDAPIHDWWLAFCLDGKSGLKSLAAVNKISAAKPDFGYCEKIYNANRQP